MKILVQVLGSTFLNFGYLQLLLWRIELSNILTFNTTIVRIIPLAEKLPNGPEINDEFIAIAVHSISIWVMAFRNSRKTRQYLDEMFLKNWEETLEKLVENKQKNMEMSSEFKTIIHIIQPGYQKKGIFHMHDDNAIPQRQERLFNLLLEARMKMLKQNSENGICGIFLHSILFGRVLEICYSVECLKLLVGGKNDVIYAIDWGNNRIGHENEMELAQKREAFLSKYYEELLHSPETTAELRIFFHENQRIPKFLLEEKLEFSNSIYSGHSLIESIIGISKTTQSINTKFEIAIVMLASEPMLDLASTITDDNSEITCLQFMKCLK